MSVVCVLLSCAVQASTGVNSGIERTTVSGTAQERVANEPWKAWGLTVQDWKQYQSIMAGPRGTWSPNATPLSVLGVHANSESERLRFARIAAELDYQRVKDEAQWQLTYDVVKERVWDELQSKEPQHLELSSVRSHHRVLLFTESTCDARCRRVMEALKAAQASVDIYFLGEATREDIHEWAKQQELSPEAVNRTRQYTLNLDNGKLKSLGRTTNDAPLLFHRNESGTYDEVSL